MLGPKKSREGLSPCRAAAFGFAVVATAALPGCVHEPREARISVDGNGQVKFVQAPLKKKESLTTHYDGRDYYFFTFKVKEDLIPDVAETRSAEVSVTRAAYEKYDKGDWVVLRCPNGRKGWDPCEEAS